MGFSDPQGHETIAEGEGDVLPSLFQHAQPNEDLTDTRPTGKLRTRVHHTCTHTRMHTHT